MRFVALLFFMVLVLAFAACGQTPPASPETDGPTNGPTDGPTNGPTVDVTEDATAGVTDEPGTEEGSAPETEPSPPESETPGELITLAPETVPEPETGAAEMPRLDIATEGGVGIESKDFYVRATVTLSGCGEDDAFANAPAGIRVRGNSTAAAPKKPYRLKFDQKQEMLGLSNGRAYRSWCLMADYYDGSMLRTFGTFRFAKALLENVYFSADCAHVEVYLNGAYQGVYLLCDQTQIGKGRVDIPEMPEGDTSVEHGYLMIGQGGRSDEPESIVVYPGITVRDRNGDEMHFSAMNFALSGGGYTEAQKQYVSDYVSGVFKVVAHAVYDHEYYDLSRGGQLIRKHHFEWAKTEEEKQIETISAVFNIDSAVSMCILDEIVKNLDAMTFNMYVDLSPGGDGVLTLAAPWDFDFSMANTHYGTTHSPSGFYATNLSYSEGMRTNLWYVMLGSIPWFEEMVKEKWQENYIELCSVVSEMESVNYAYDAAFNRDFDRWGLPANRQLIHHHDQSDLRRFDNHEKAGSFVTDWLKKRLAWLDRQWGDGTHWAPDAPRAEELELTLTDPNALPAIVTGIKRCHVKPTAAGLLLFPTAEAYDPYFSFDYDLLGEAYDAGDYSYLEFTYRIVEPASADTFQTELFLCSGSVTGATGGVSTSVTVIADGEWHTVKLDLALTGFWSGTIHEIRMDFFSACEAGDRMLLKDFKLLPE